MTGKTQHIVKLLFRGGTLESVPLQQLEELVQLYPSFGLGHYLLSKKLQQENGGYAFLQQTQKTALYFSNPFWLQWLLKNGGKEKQEIDPPVMFVEDHQQPAEESKPEPEFLPAEPKADNKETVTHKMDEQIGKSVSQQAVNASKEVIETGPAFEPYYTIDYFASQGIKFIQELNPNDKLGRQLKSFTEWLKTMKKLPQKTLELQAADEPIDENIEISAAHSIEGKEVLTEAMAEVLIKQGKTEKAAEIYRKLSLHNPEKSVYFAARIEQLKVH